MALTPAEAARTNVAEIKTLVDQHEAAIDEALALRFVPGVRISVEVSAGPKVPENLRAKVEEALKQRYREAGWELEYYYGGTSQRDDSPAAWKLAERPLALP